jgi:hypothetical protein
MTGTVDDKDFTPEQIASELNRIAHLVRQGPMDAKELAKLTARVEIFARVILQQPSIDPALAQRLQDLAEQLRTGPVKRKNGSTS